MKSKLAKNIIKFRKRKGLSQEKLAKLAGINRGTVAYYENDENAKSYIDNLYAISKVLGVKIENLLETNNQDENDEYAPEIDGRTMKKIKIILSLPKHKRHMIYTMAEALAKCENMDKRNSEKLDK